MDDAGGHHLSLVADTFVGEDTTARYRIVVTSSHSADELHQRFRIGETIAVINKTEAKQQEAFLMILDSIMRR